jgi:hypothetical protein
MFCISHRLYSISLAYGLLRLGGSTCGVTPAFVTDWHVMTVLSPTVPFQVLWGSTPWRAGTDGSRAIDGPATLKIRQAWKAYAWWQLETVRCPRWLCLLDSRRLQRRESSVGWGRLSAQPDLLGARRPGPPALRAEHLLGNVNLLRAGGSVGAACVGSATE